MTQRIWNMVVESNIVDTLRTGIRDGSRGRKASGPIPEHYVTGRVAGLHWVSTHNLV